MKYTDSIALEVRNENGLEAEAAFPPLINLYAYSLKHIHKLMVCYPQSQNVQTFWLMITTNMLDTVSRVMQGFKSAEHENVPGV
jgi:hypothetical protein